MFRYMTHWLFGWDYVHLRNSATEIIRRVRYTSDGLVYIKYFSSHLVFLNTDKGWTITPLTYKNS